MTLSQTEARGIDAVLAKLERLERENDAMAARLVAAEGLAGALQPFAQAMQVAHSTTNTHTLGLLEAAAFYHLRGGSFSRASTALAAWAAANPREGGEG